MGQKGKGIKRKMTMQLEEINQKVLAKEGRLKKYRDSVNNTDKTGHSKTTKKILQQVKEDDKKTYKQPDAREEKSSG